MKPYVILEQRGIEKKKIGKARLKRTPKWEEVTELSWPHVKGRRSKGEKYRNCKNSKSYEMYLPLGRVW